jgi:SAM-dependent methyltransferase
VGDLVSETLSGFYAQRIYPHLLELAIRPFAPYRRDALAGALGKVLEVGFGTGANLPHYPPGVTDLTTVDPMIALPGALRRRLEAARFPVHRYALPADKGLPFESGSFDAVTITWTLCTIPDPQAALREMLRVLRPGAPLLFAEHGHSDDPRIARWQDRLDGIWRTVASGCHLNRAMDNIIASSGFRIEALRRFDVPRLPRTHGHLYVGTAVAQG